MTRSKGTLLVLALMVWLAATPLPAQTRMSQAAPSGSSAPATSGTNQTGSTGTGTPAAGTRTARTAPCWQQAGIPQSVLQQRRTIEENTRAQVESVCADTSLTQQQKHAKVQEVRAQAHQQIEATMNEQQRQAMQSCRQQRGEAETHAQGQAHRTGGGPCGETGSSGEPPTARSQPSEQR